MPSSYDRRIGRRVAIEAVPILWRVTPRTTGRRGLRTMGAPREAPAIIEASVTGLKVRAPAVKRLSTGSTVSIEVDGIAGTVVIRRITPVPDTGMCDYGVRFSDPSGQLASWCHRLIPRRIDAAGRPLP